MGLSEIELFRLEKAVREMCLSRNQNIPAELGKAQYEIKADGVYFSKQCFLLDSSHINAESPVALLSCNSETRLWGLYIAEFEESSGEITDWIKYSYLAESQNYEEQLNELLHDPKNIFW